MNSAQLSFLWPTLVYLLVSIKVGPIITLLHFWGGLSFKLCDRLMRRDSNIRRRSLFKGWPCAVALVSLTNWLSVDSESFSSLNQSESPTCSTYVMSDNCLTRWLCKCPLVRISVQLREYGHRSRVTLMVTWKQMKIGTSLCQNVSKHRQISTSLMINIMLTSVRLNVLIE